MFHFARKLICVIHEIFSFVLYPHYIRFSNTLNFITCSVSTFGLEGVGMRGVRNQNISCSCDFHRCQCVHHVFAGGLGVERVDTGTSTI